MKQLLHFIKEEKPFFEPRLEWPGKSAINRPSYLPKGMETVTSFSSRSGAKSTDWGMTGKPKVTEPGSDPVRYHSAQRSNTATVACHNAIV